MSSTATDSTFSVPLVHFRCASVESLGCDDESTEQLSLPTGLNRFIGDQANHLLKVFSRSDESSDRDEVSTVWSNGSAWPLVFFGPSGAGKTSLALNFLSSLYQTKVIDPQANNSSQRPGYLTATDFDRRFRSAMETDSVVDFRLKLAARTGLLIDNLNKLENKPAAQHEVVRLIDTMVEKGRPVLFTMDLSPYETTQLIPQLTSRLGSGLALPVMSPGPEARFEIIRELADLHQLRFTEEAMKILIERLPLNVPGINHFLLHFKLSMETGSQFEVNSLIDADNLIRSFCSINSSTETIGKTICKVVASAFDVKVSDLLSQSRKQTTVMARGVAIWLNRELTKTSFKKIGTQFGNRDHSTIMHAWRKINGLVNLDLTNSDEKTVIRSKILRLKQTIEQQMTAHT